MKNSSTAPLAGAAGVAPAPQFQPLPEDDDGALAAWLTLALSEGVSSTQGRRLLAAFGLPGQVLRASRAALRRVVPAAVAQALGRGPLLQGRVAAALAWVAAPGRRIVCLGDSDYPPLLLEIPDPPLLLYVEGDVSLLQRDALAVVGSRNATRQGLAHAQQFAVQSSRAGLTIISGLALGIDAAAHAGGLAGAGSSVAVIGTGIDICYPRRHEALAQQLAAQGCIVSEYPLGTPPLAANFPRRNRLISGLARGVLVVEAALRSGSLITARMAAEQGREVFAIPGSIHAPLSRGCHALIRQGAKLVETTADILDELGMPATLPARQAGGAVMATEPSCPDEATRLVAQAMAHDPLDLDTLAQRCGLDAAALAAALLGLELAGRIEVLPGPRYRRMD